MSIGQRGDVDQPRTHPLDEQLLTISVVQATSDGLTDGTLFVQRR
jgi:hypothetical protein